MLKKFFYSIGVLALICFSFYYTDAAVEVIKRNDPIMKQIVEVDLENTVEPIDAVILNNGIIPGISGIKIDIDKSYEKMKHYGSYDSSLLIFKEVIPTISISDNYDKFILKGNTSKKGISIVFKLKNTSYLDDILSILELKNFKTTFFIDSNIMSIDLLEKFNNPLYEVELLSEDYSMSSIQKANKLLDKYNEKLNYCYYNEPSNILDTCKKAKLYSFVPNILGDTMAYNNIKSHVSNGSIIALDNNIQTVKELSLILNYLNQKGYKNFLLKDLLSE